MLPSNGLIDGLSRTQRQRLLKRCVPVELVLGAILCEADRPLRHVYFPLTGFISLVALVGSHPPWNWLIGSEGMFGARWRWASIPQDFGVVQAKGMRSPDQRANPARTERNPSLRRMFSRYLYVMFAQLATAACTRFPRSKRASRWLLMTHDRAQGPLRLTQFSRRHAGVRNAGDRRRRLRQEDHSLHARRHPDPEPQGLESRSCECYEATSRTTRNC
jgi:hypothetical protein